MKSWKLKEPDRALVAALSSGLGVSRVTAAVLANRGLTTVAEARWFLGDQPDASFPPALLADMEPAADRIIDALVHKERMLVFGDYDVDGVTATALMVDALRLLGGQVDYYIPHRSDQGYGPNVKAIEQAARDGISLAISVDCGIGAGLEIEHANRLGLDFIVTDHHQPPDSMPAAFAIVNPHRPGSLYPFPDLAGVGVAFKLVQCLSQKMPGRIDPERYLDLVCLGTVADVVPLLGENRFLVRRGLRLLARTDRPGLRELMGICSIRAGELGARDISHVLAPRLNAAGRLGHAGQAVELLLAGNDGTARRLAQKLQELNTARQGLEQRVFTEAMAQAVGEGFFQDRVVVLAGAGWHPGVIGIVAARLVDRFSRPVVLLAIEQENARGSARSLAGFDILKAIESCADLCSKSGGHRQAAGLEIPARFIALFRERLNRFAAEAAPGEQAEAQLEVDTEITADEINQELLGELEQLAPFGMGNPQPLLVGRDLTILEGRAIGAKGAHLKLKIMGAGRKVVDGVGFGLGQYTGQVRGVTDLVFHLERNTWNGRTRIQLNVQDIGCLHQQAAYDENTNRSVCEARSWTDKFARAVSSGEQIAILLKEKNLVALAAPGPWGRNCLVAVARSAAVKTNRMVLMVAPFRGMVGRLFASLECHPLASGLPVLKAHTLSPHGDREAIARRLRTGGASIGVVSRELLPVLTGSSSPGSAGLLVVGQSCFLAGDGGPDPAEIGSWRRNLGNPPVLAHISAQESKPPGFTLFGLSGDSDAELAPAPPVERACPVDRLEYLRQSLFDGRKCLVAVRTGAQARQVADRLASMLAPGRRQQVACCDPDMSPAERGSVEDALVKGDFGLVAAAGSLGGLGLQADRLLFWSPPLSLAAMHDQAVADGEFSEVVWLSDAGELGAHRNLVRAWAPDANDLLKFRDQLFRESKERVFGEPGGLDSLRVLGPGGVPYHPGRIWVKILLELGLICGESRGGRYILHPGPGECPDWFRSPTYREGQIEWVEWEQISAILEGDAASLRDILEDPLNCVRRACSHRKCEVES